MQLPDIKVSTGEERPLDDVLLWQIENVFLEMAKELPISMSIHVSDQEEILTSSPKNLSDIALLRNHVERWFFHQQFFHIYLEIQMVDSSAVSSVKPFVRAFDGGTEAAMLIYCRM
jgi:hypothetical protein